ncbi:MAG: 2-polyprenyl-3-methyl-6-methoxy-1,4-benzoquinone monooxygenase [Xanthomonadaceae bacterium]|nr:2-polyprenyl-3-methyl-6-methoxy-1,4-benzoquinone monooxygenase [Xanthomonadaceae bacterium]
MNFIDRCIIQLDQALRISLAPAPPSDRASPAEPIDDCPMDPDEQSLATGLMRINHSGEVCAQALYAGQAATARGPAVREEMKQAAREEVDHLRWCADRLDELDSAPSRLNPLWYAGSFTIGALAGAAGDRWSLGFVEATERQVEAHLQSHLDRLPEKDLRSRAIVAQMKLDEARHAELAACSGAARLPPPLQTGMAVSANVMKWLAFRI